MRKMVFGNTIGFILVIATPYASAGDDLIDRWATAAGGRDKVAAIKTTYREANLEFGAYKGTVKVWHTADGKYRKEEKIGDLSTVEIFDGAKGTIKEGHAPPREMTSAELELSRAKRFANANAMFFAFFPERRHGTIAVEALNTVVLKPEGGVEWRGGRGSPTMLPQNTGPQKGRRRKNTTFYSSLTHQGKKTLKKK